MDQKYLLTSTFRWPDYMNLIHKIVRWTLDRKFLNFVVINFSQQNRSNRLIFGL